MRVIVITIDADNDAIARQLASYVEGELGVWPFISEDVRQASANLIRLVDTLVESSFRL